VPLHALAGTLALWGAATVLARNWSEAGALAAAGEWSLVNLYGLIGFLGGTLAGLLAAARMGVRFLQADAEAWIAGLSTERGRALFPSVPRERLSGDYGRVLDAVADATVGRLPLPGFAARLARSRLRVALLEDFLASCRDAGAPEVGYPELRTWLLRRGLPYLVAPLQNPLRIWRGIVLGTLALLVTLALGIAALGDLAGATTVVLAIFALTGAVIALSGVRASGRRVAPLQWRIGMLTLGAQVAAWPALGHALRGHDLGMAWILVVVAALLGLSWSVRRLIAAGPVAVEPVGEG
jgi:hypothetical protein